MPRVFGTLHSSSARFGAVGQTLRWDIRQLSMYDSATRVFTQQVFIEPFVAVGRNGDYTYDEQFKLTPEDAMTLARVIHDAAVRAMAGAQDAYGPDDYPWPEEAEEDYSDEPPEDYYDPPDELPF